MSTIKRDEIVRVALELIVEHGFHGTSMAMIADQAKVGAGTIYRYFKSKDVLIIDLFQEVSDKISKVLMEESLEELDIHGRFVQVGCSFMKYLINNPIDFRYIEQFFHSPYGVEQRRDEVLSQKGKNKLFSKLFSEGMQQGKLKNLPQEALCALWFGPIMAMMRDHVAKIFMLNDQLIQQIAEACWDGIKQSEIPSELDRVI